MAVKTILRMGNPSLHVKAQAVKEFNTPALDNLIEDLFDTMEQQGGVGIAATQIGIPLQVTVFGFNASKRYPHAQPIAKTVLINPKIQLLNEDMNEDWEGCLSVRDEIQGLRGLVPRYTNIIYRGVDQLGNVIEQQVKGFHARLIQHEVDHLNGLIFPQRIRDLRYFGFEQELVEVMNSLGSKLS